MWFQIIELIKIALTLSTLILTSVMDLRTREVRDEIWIIYGSIGGTLTLIEFTLGYITLTQTLLSIFTSLILGLTLFYALGFGGADAKLIWVLGITHIINPLNIHLNHSNILQPIKKHQMEVFRKKIIRRL